MKKVNIVLCPMDIVMFRDPRPFELGGYARSYNIPLPSTFSGVIRSLLREEFPNKKDLYENEKELKWRVRGPVLSLIKEDENMVKVEEFYPLPNDIFKDIDGRITVPKPSEPYSYEVDGFRVLSPPRLKDGEILKRPEEELISKNALMKYLKGEIIMRSELKKFEDLFSRTERPGVALDEKKAARFGMFYRIEALEAFWGLKAKRMVRGGYVGTVLGDNDVINRLKVVVKKRVVRFGGESRPSSILVVPKEEDRGWEEAKRRIADQVSKEKRFKIYLATPAIFGNGSISRWIPKWLNEQTLEGCFLEDGPRVKLVGACMGRRIGISGWDYKKGHVKPMYFGVPASSVFYFELKEEVSVREVHEKIINQLEANNISDVMSSLGFGTAFVGVW